MIKILTVAGLATFEVYAAIPTGFALGLGPWTIFLASLVGGLIGVFVAAFLGDKIKAFIGKYRKPKPPKPTAGWVQKIWEKYGVIGLGIVGTFTIGAPISLGIGVGLNVAPARLLPWCCIGVLARCAIYTTLGHFGMKML